MKSLRLPHIRKVLLLSRGLSCVSANSSSGIRLRNSIVSSIESPAPSVIESKDGALTWYSCGPTVYDAAHIGHARTYVCTDIIRRILTDIHNKDVNFAVGVTDIDDKIIDRAAARGIKGWPDTERMVRGLEHEFFSDLDALNVRRPDAILRVTEHIPEIISYIEAILATGRAYSTPDGVYFSVASCGDNYLVFQDLKSVSVDAAELLATTEIPLASSGVSSGADSADSGDNASFTLPPLGNKKDRRDFALWKAVKENEPFWDSPWGPGRPGWHIECSAVTHSYFGSKMDIHSGGIDLQFPHHTNEIAQCAAHSCSAPADWVKFWIHTGHLYIEGRKMSKSLKNFISIQDYLQGSYSPNPAVDFRIFCLQFKYHTNIHFSQERVDEAALFRRKIENYLKLSGTLMSSVRCAEAVSQVSGDIRGEITGDALSSSQGVSNTAFSKPTEESRALRAALSHCQRSVKEYLSDDFDTPEALKHISHLVGHAMIYCSLAARNNSNSSNTSISQRKECIIAKVTEDITRSILEGEKQAGKAASSGQQPTEPIAAVTYYVLDILGKLGVDFKQNQQIQPQGDRAGAAAPCFTRGTQSASETAILESLLAFRSKVRSYSLNCMKSIKTQNKIKKSEFNSVDKAVGEDIAKTTVGDVLTACDSLRVSIGAKLGLHIEDYEGVSVWRPAEQLKDSKVDKKDAGKLKTETKPEGKS